MRILYVTQIVPFPPHGGVLQRGYNLLRELGHRHDVHLLAFHHRDELPPGDAVDKSKQELSEFCRSVEYFDLWPKRSVIHKLAGLVAALMHPAPFSVLAHRNSQLSKRMVDTCSGMRPPDIVHLDTIALAPFARFCSKLPLVLAHHNIESQLMRRRAQFERGWLQQRYVSREAGKLLRLELEIAGRFAANITVSHADAEALRQICPNAVCEVIPNGVDTNYFAPIRGRETSMVVFTGGMNMFANRDGIDWFVETVWPIVKTRIPFARFVAIGQRPSERLLEAARSNAGVEAPGFVEDVRPVVAQAAVYVVPLRVGGGTRLKVLDAMAQGKAIVSTSLGAEGIDVRDGEHLILADEAEDFANRIIDLLQRPDERLRLGDAARRQVEANYSWASLGDRLTGVYARAIERVHR